MITTIFLLFVAFGISLAALIYGFGGIFPILVGLSIIAVVVRMIADRQTQNDDEHMAV